MDSSSEKFNLAQYCLEKNCRLQPEKTALLFVSVAEKQNSWSFQEFQSATLRVAGWLNKQGFAKQSRVLLRLPHTPEYAIVFFASISIGLVPIPTSPQLTIDELSFLIQDSSPSLIVYSSDLKIPNLPKDIVTLESHAFINMMQTHEKVANPYQTKANDPAYLMYTSGTSGQPKGVLHAQRTVLGRIPMQKGWTDFQSTDRVCHAGHLNWSYTLGVGLMDSWVAGATSVLYGGEKNPQIWVSLLQKQKITIFAAVPSLYRQILKYSSEQDWKLPHLRHALSAGETLPKNILQQWYEQTGTYLYEALGMTEISTYISTSPHMTIKSGSVGKPQVGRKVRILPMNTTDKEVAPKEIGLLAVHRSDLGLMLGYWNREEEEKKMFRGEWFVGGDLASMDEDGYIWYQGRNNELMNAFGYRVSPIEVENTLRKHPDILDVAVTEIRISEQISLIGAFVILQENKKLSNTALKKWSLEKMADYKCPKEFWFVSQFPRTTNGKLIRKKLPTLLPN